MSNSGDTARLVQTMASPERLDEYLQTRRRALIGQVKALEAQRAAILQEVSWITKNTGPKIVIDKE